jgi:hypothetical protein
LPDLPSTISTACPLRAAALALGNSRINDRVESFTSDSLSYTRGLSMLEENLDERLLNN